MGVKKEALKKDRGTQRLDFLQDPWTSLHLAAATVSWRPLCGDLPAERS